MTDSPLSSHDSHLCAVSSRNDFDLVASLFHPIPHKRLWLFFLKAFDCLKIFIIRIDFLKPLILHKDSIAGVSKINTFSRIKDMGVDEIILIGNG